MRMKIGLVLLLSVVPACRAQALPDAPKPKEPGSRAVWITETVAVGALLATDYSLTAAKNHRDACVPNCDGLPLGPHAEATAWLYGRYPSNARLAATGAAIFAATAFTLRKAERSKHPWVRFSGWLLASTVGVVEVGAIQSWVHIR